MTSRKEREREIQQTLRRIAMDKREKRGEYVKVGYKKIFINRKWYIWDKEKERLEELGKGSEMTEGKEKRKVMREVKYQGRGDDDDGGRKEEQLWKEMNSLRKRLAALEEEKSGRRMYVSAKRDEEKRGSIYRSERQEGERQRERKRWKMKSGKRKINELMDYYV